LIPFAFSLLAIVLAAGGYALGARRRHIRERSMTEAVDRQSEQLVLAERELLGRFSLDPVTGLPIQQALQEFLDREWRRAVRDGATVSLVMVELDHFGAYNERSGKPKGDICLKTVADTLKRCLRRPGDFLARYGSGRFAIVLGGVDVQGALVLAETLRETVEALRLPNPASPTSPIVTLTLGVTSARAAREGPWQDIELIAAAERGLAEAREAGRNRIVFTPTRSG
jgi:two-component system cell cycle response regulator